MSTYTLLTVQMRGYSSVFVDDDFFKVEDIDENKISVQDDGEHARLKFL